jgi:predicted ATP-grasp superfamily ATP-dependent carboligase
LIAFVTDGDERPALAITRSLGRRGVSVLVGGENAASLASCSKYCLRHVRYPSPYRHPEAFERFLFDFVGRERIDLVMPVTDVTTYSIARQRDALQHYSAIAAPPFEAFDFVANKWSLLQRAAKCGIPIPRTHFVDAATGLRGILAQIEYPVVVKPARSRILTDGGWLTACVHYAQSESDLVGLYRETGYLASYPSLIQERISGPGIGVFALCDRGRLLATFGHRRLREKPPSGGVSVLCESVAVDPDFRGHAARLLGSVGWHGVAMLEYKQDRRTGRSFLMEVNGRFWGSLQLAVDAGVDFPYLSAQLALGQPLDIPTTYEKGVRSRWLLGDLDHLYLRLFRSNRDLPECAPSRLQVLVDFLKLASPAERSEVLRLDDPGPMFYELGKYLKELSESAAQLVGRPVARWGSARLRSTTFSGARPKRQKC